MRDSPRNVQGVHPDSIRHGMGGRVPHASFAKEWEYCNAQQFQGGIVFKAHGLRGSINSRLESNGEEDTAKLRQNTLICTASQERGAGGIGVYPKHHSDRPRHHTHPRARPRVYPHLASRVPSHGNKFNSNGSKNLVAAQ